MGFLTEAYVWAGISAFLCGAATIVALVEHAEGRLGKAMKWVMAAAIMALAWYAESQ